VAITVVNFLMAMNFYLLMMVVAKFATDRFDASPAMAGLAASIFVVGGLITRPLAGRLIHRLGQLKTLYLGVVMTVVWTALYFAAADVGLLLLVRLLHGAAFGITSVTTATMIVGVIPSARYGEGIGTSLLVRPWRLPSSVRGAPPAATREFRRHRHRQHRGAHRGVADDAVSACGAR
jgi:MFS family permease